LQPLEFNVPSSHISVPTENPSPRNPSQSSFVVGVPPEHTHFGNYPLQSALHPFPSPELSSHPSPGILSPSLQIGVQTSLEVGDPPEHVHPVALPVLQPMLQPNPSSVSSSQSSFPTTNPSPQISVQVEGVLISPPEQVQPSIGPEQSGLQPLRVLSHGSPVTTQSSPHFGSHWVATVGEHEASHPSES
jgi:hypothetical protein